MDVDALDKGENRRLLFRSQVVKVQRVVLGVYRLNGLSCDRRGFGCGCSLNSRGGGCRRSSLRRLFLFFAGKNQRGHGFIVHRHELLFLSD